MKILTVKTTSIHTLCAHSVFYSNSNNCVVKTMTSKGNKIFLDYLIFINYIINIGKFIHSFVEILIVPFKRGWKRGLSVFQN